MWFTNGNYPGVYSDYVSALPATSSDITQNKIVYRTPSRPDFWFGTYLVLRKTPCTVSEKKILRLSDGLEVSRKRTIIQWEVPENAARIRNAPRITIPATVVIKMSSIMVAERSELRLPPLTTELRIVRAQSSADFSRILNLAIAHINDEPQSVATKDFITWKHSEFRKMVDAGETSWWMLLHRGELVAQCGLAKRLGIAVFQEVTTHPANRRRGFGQLLCGGVLQLALANTGTDKFIVAADKGSGAEAMYRSLGFQIRTCQVSAILDRG